MLTLAATQLEHELASAHRQQDELAERAARLRGDALHAALIESNRLATQSQRLIRDLTSLYQRCEEARDRLERARTTIVPLPDDLTPEEHEQRLAAAVTEGDEVEAMTQGLMADFLTVADLAELYGRSQQAINGWCRNGFPRGRAYWDATAWVVRGPRNKVLPVSAIDEMLLSDIQRARLQVIRQRRAQANAA